MPNRYVVVSGNLSDGFTFSGPFLDFDEAAEWCQGMDTDTWVSTLVNPFPDNPEMELANLCPDGSLERDNNGQFVIYTGEYDADYDSDSQ